MKKKLLWLPLATLALTGCGTAERMNCLINQSTVAIQRNTQTVQCSTQAIRNNAALINQSTQALEENRRNLEQMF